MLMWENSLNDGGEVTKQVILNICMKVLDEEVLQDWKEDRVTSVH